MISKVFNHETVRRLAGSKVFARGEKYARSGHVVIVDETATRRFAHVTGTTTYRTELSDDGSPDWSCTCPFADDGAFCKHCVAVALVTPRPPTPTPTTNTATPEAELLAGHILGLSVEQLRDLVTDRVATDPALRTKMLAQAMVASAAPLDGESWRRRIIDATDPYHDYVSWQEADGWADAVFDVLEALNDLIDAGYAEAVIELAEFAFRRIEGAMEYVDDSSSGVLRDLSERAGALHLSACSSAKPDPIALAGRLISLEVDSELEGLFDAVSAYADLLGRDGLHEYRRLIEARRIPGASNEWFVRRALESVLEELGETDELLAVLESNGRPGDQIKVVEILVADGRRNEAIEHGQKWLASGGSVQLRDMIAELLRDRGDQSEALKLYVRDFQARPSVEAYQRLLDQPDVTEAEWYEACVETTRRWVMEQPPRAGPWGSTGDVLVEMLLLDDRFDEAWQAGTDFGCREDFRLTIAGARETTHPVEAIDLYEERAFRLIGTKDPKLYPLAIELIGRIRQCCIYLDDPTRFRAAVHRARTEHKPKRNVQKLLNERGW